MHSTRVLSVFFGLVSFLFLANTAVAAPLSIAAPLAFDIDLPLGLDLSCLLGCPSTQSQAQPVQVLTGLQTKVATDISVIANLSVTATVDLSLLNKAYATLVADINAAAAELGAGTALALYKAGAVVDETANLTGKLLLAIFYGIANTLSVPNIEASLGDLNNCLVDLVGNIETSVGANVTAKIGTSAAGIQSTVPAAVSGNIFASLWAMLFA